MQTNEIEHIDQHNNFYSFQERISELSGEELSEHNKTMSTKSQSKPKAATFIEQPMT